MSDKPDLMLEVAQHTLALVGTVPEVCERWVKTRKSVMMQIYKGRIQVVQIGTSYIVYLPSVVKLWGPAQKERE